MLTDFKLKIENFGPINEANLDMSKINIIAGKNASGKTTISKLLFCILTAFSSDGEYLTYRSMEDRLELLMLECLKIQDIGIVSKISLIKSKLAGDHNFKLDIIKECYEELNSILQSEDFENKEYVLAMIENDKKTLDGISSPEFNHDLLFNLIRNEFSSDEQILDNFNNSHVVIYDDHEHPFVYDIKIDDAIDIELNNGLKNLTSNGEAIYIETPYFLDFNQNISQNAFHMPRPYHQMLLSLKLKNQSSKNDILDTKHNGEMIKSQNKINKLLNGKFKQNNNGFIEFTQDGKTFDLENISTGLKSIGVIQLLLENRKLKENCFLIMDEPEVHLHPEWQLKLAELLVMLVKDLNLNLFINSHSPQFIEAIEVYSTSYGLKDETKFYLTQENNFNGQYNVKQLNHDELYRIYDDLGNPYDVIDEIRGKNIANHL